MNISEKDLYNVLDKLDALVTNCVTGKLSFSEFLTVYGYPFGEYALDGYESNDKEKNILAKLQIRILLHERIAKEALSLLRSNNDAGKIEYQQAD